MEGNINKIVKLLEHSHNTHCQPGQPGTPRDQGAAASQREHADRQAASQVGRY